MQWFDFYVREVGIQGSTLELTGQGHSRLRIQVLEADILRIVLLPDGKEREELTSERLIWQNSSAFSNPQVEWNEGKRKTGITTSALHIIVENHPFLIQYETALGAPIGLDWKYSFAARGGGVRHEMLQFQHEHVYGLGGLPGLLNRNGRKYLVNAAAGKGFPFYICWHPETQVAYGLLYDDSTEANFFINQRFGEFAGRRAYQSETSSLDFYFILGPSIPEVVEKLSHLPGTPMKPIAAPAELGGKISWKRSRLDYPAASSREISGLPPDELLLNKIQEDEPSLGLYLNSLSLEHAFTGHSIQRPLVSAFPFDPLAADESFEFMLGSNLLAAPVTKPKVRKWKVYLPEATNWFDFQTGRFYAGGQQVTLPAALLSILLFVPQGGMIPAVGKGVGADPCLLCFPGERGNSEFRWYIPTTQGKDFVVNFTMEALTDEIKVSGVLEAKGTRLPWKKIRVVLPPGESRRLVTSGFCKAGDQMDSIRAQAITSSPE